MKSSPTQVLFIDDSEDDVDLLTELISSAGIELNSVRVDTPSALEASLAFQKWDIVISDYSMPAFSGLEALKIVMNLDQDIPFILLSGIVDEEVAIAAMRDGASDYIMKSRLKRLVPAIQREIRESGVRKTRRRMLKELDDAKLIQSSFLPEPHHDFGAVEISGHYEPASECSGDCWYYCENQNKIFFFVGDVTGHGVAAALITSSIRSAFSVIESNVEMTTQNIIRIVNKAVYETYKGKVTMTFFVSSIDKGSGEVSYCNASHEPPFILKKGEGVPSKKDLVFLNITKNPPIGRSPDSHFNVSQINLEPGDLIFAHTDGLFDLKDPRGISWGERNAYNGILKSVAQSWSPKQIVGDLNSLVQEFRNETPLIDDVTFLVCAFKGE